jgi:hypothetical protein
MLPIVLAPAELEQLHADASAGQELTVDLERKVIVRPEGKGEISFQVDDFRRHCLINGLDDIGRESRCFRCFSLCRTNVLTVRASDSHPATPRRDRTVRDSTDGHLALVGRTRLRQEGRQGSRQAGQSSEEEDGLVEGALVWLPRGGDTIMKTNKNDDSARTSTILPFLDFGRGSLDSKMYILGIYYTLYSICRYELFLCLKCKETRAERRGDPSTSPTDIILFEFASG